MKKLIILTIILFTVQFLAPIFGQTEQQPRLVVQTGHRYDVYSVAFSPDGKILASGGWDKTIKLWNVTTGQEINSFNGHTGIVNSVGFSPDGKILVSGGKDKTIKLWNVASGQQIKSLVGHTDRVNSVAFSPDGRTLASGSYKTIKLWNVENGEEIKTLEGHPDYVNSIAFSPDGKTLASGSCLAVNYICVKGEIKLWNVISGLQIKSLVVNSLRVNLVAFSPDGKTLASASCRISSDDSSCVRGEIKFWNAKTGQLIKSLIGHTNSVNSIAFSPDGRVSIESCGNRKNEKIAYPSF